MMTTRDQLTRVAICDEDTEFFPTRADLAGPAVLLCFQCPASHDCLAVGMQEQYGVYGGVPERERVLLRDPAYRAVQPNCHRCGEPIVPNIGESATSFARRITCSHSCTRRPLTLEQIETRLRGAADAVQVANDMRMSVAGLREHLLRQGRSDLFRRTLVPAQVPAAA